MKEVEEASKTSQQVALEFPLTNEYIKNVCNVSAPLMDSFEVGQGGSEKVDAKVLEIIKKIQEGGQPQKDYKDKQT